MADRLGRLILIWVTLSGFGAAGGAETVYLRFESDGGITLAGRPVPAGTSPIETAIYKLVAGPTEEEAQSGLLSRIPAGVQVMDLIVSGDMVSVDLSEEILTGLDEAALLGIFDQFRTTLLDFPEILSIRLTCKGELLSSYLEPAVSYGTPAPAVPPLNVGLEGTGLAGKNITIGPSHGRYWNGSGWYWQRSDPCGFGEAVLEDTNSIRLMQFLHQYLTQDGATVHVPRELDESNCCNGSTGLHWWKMAAYSWLRHAGLPCSVWGSSSGSCSSETGPNRYSDDIRARPLFADYRGSDIYVSHHTNAGGGGTANGTITFRDTAMEHPEHEAASYSLALNIQNSIVATIREMYDAGWYDRGVADSNGGFGEIRIPDRPACLIELAFHDNCTRDALYLTDNFFRSLSEWAVYKGICNYFGNAPTWDKYSCEYVSDTIPSNMSPGQSCNVSVTFRNRGVLWTTARDFRLGAVDDSDPFTSFTRLDISGEVRPGQTYTFSFTMTAPSSPGTYITDWRMVRDGVAWFGPTHSEQVNVGSGPFPPTITQHPSSQTVAPGDTATFTVQAIGDAPLSYQWQKDGGDLSNGGRISGATSTTLQISSVNSGDAGDYQCVVTNPYGSATSNPATLTVYSGPIEFIVESRSGGQNYDHFSKVGDWRDSTSKSSAPGTTAGIGSVWTSTAYAGRSATYSFTPNVTGTYEVFATWVYSTNACPSAEHIVTHADGSATLYMDQLSGGNAWNSLGEYDFNAGIAYTVVQRTDGSSGGGVFRADAVKWELLGGPVDPPIITEHPSSQSVCPGAAAVFSVTAIGEGPLSYQWQKNEANLSDGGHYSGATTSALTVSNADGGDVAGYRCVVSNAGGDTTSNSASLSLKAATTITQHPLSQEVTPGTDVSFTVQATGEGTLSYQWQKNGGNLSNGGRISGATTATLQISDVDETDQGEYRCVVTAGCGSATSNAATLTVSGSPAVPGDFDGDGDVDQEDFGFIQACLTGTAAGPPAPGCEDANLDGDNDVDQADMGIFQGCVSGANVPGDPDCAG